MNDRDPADTIVIVVSIIIVSITAGFFIGAKLSINDIRTDAVKNKVAIWVANEDGSVKFEWKVPVEKND